MAYCVYLRFEMCGRLRVFLQCAKFNVAYYPARAIWQAKDRERKDIYRGGISRVWELITTHAGTQAGSGDRRWQGRAAHNQAWSLLATASRSNFNSDEAWPQHKWHWYHPVNGEAGGGGRGRSAARSSTATQYENAGDAHRSYKNVVLPYFPWDSISNSDFLQCIIGGRFWFAILNLDAWNRSSGRILCNTGVIKHMVG